VFSLRVGLGVGWHISLVTKIQEVMKKEKEEEEEEEEEEEGGGGGVEY